MGLICKPRPTAPKKRPGFPVPGNMVVYHASVSAEGWRRRSSASRGAFRCTWSQRSSLWPGVHGKGLTSLRQQLKLDQDRRSFGPEGPEVWVLWGPSGTGKSRFVAARWPDAFWKAPESKWWDGYSGHETVVLDDFKDYGMPLVDLQRLLDWYPLWVEVKGERPHAGQEVRHHGEHLPDDWYVRGDPHRTIRRRIADFAERFGRLIECQAGWEPPGAACRGRGSG